MCAKLENCIYFWCPHLKNDVEKLKMVQKRMTKISAGWRKSLRDLNWFSLSKRKMRDANYRCISIFKGRKSHRTGPFVS